MKKLSRYLSIFLIAGLSLGGLTACDDGVEDSIDDAADEIEDTVD